ncbi:diacylglycerol/lipid kinase family protein [Tepidiforma thermophila]|uniref:YegS/Rv2252/BmrU family lipid kinase n=1 Tax=Tepidiforma thermophila (strain KCTC 52669 / CGMCC 1.13589 / G233) TaxID=2761530 RepID=A0A2A9HD70_TEPT2|nr:diacylglycerol kinase family protein [Tepidiforma thermophila]PFG73263.1 YegS/Rv2252/BmrU family lipid kinase [Tepidiforma thermophila]
MTEVRTATLLVNPAARGVARRFDAAQVVRRLEERGIEVRLAVPGSPEEATAEARAAAARGDDLCFVVGGDGTLRQAAEGLAGSATALAAIPAGTVNIWARETGIPQDVLAAVDLHLAGQTAAMDLGRANGHAFLLMAGIGWDAEIAAGVNPRLKRAAGDLAYILNALVHLPALRTHPARWRADGRSYREPLAWMVLGNTRLYGGRIHLTPEARVDDGRLDLVAFCPHGPGETLAMAVRVLAGRREGRHVVGGRFAEIAVETPGLPVQLDGDTVGATPMTFRVEPGALRVRVPAGPLPALWGGGAQGPGW